MSNFEKKTGEVLVENAYIGDLGEFLDQLPIGTFKSDEEGNLIYENEYLTKLISGQLVAQSKEASSLEDYINHVIKGCLTTGKSFLVEGEPFENSKGEQIFLTLRTVALKRDNRKRVTGKRGATAKVVGMVEDISEKTRLEKSLGKKISELSIICEVGNVLRGTLNLEEILEIILIGVTAGQGLGFNRAFLLLLNEEETLLEGKIAIGPSNPEEAKRIWEDLSTRKQSLEEVLHSYKDALGKKDILVNDLVKKLRIPSSDQKNFLIQSMQQKKACSVRKNEVDSEANKKFCEILGTDSLAVAPLVSKDKVIGVLLADNSINQKPIEEEDIELMQVLAHHASTAIESSKLYQKLGEQVNKLEEANKRIAENAQRLLKAEKLSVLGEITSQVAHELRNPITIIGGFAHSLMKKKDAKDPDYEYLNIIAKETERVEKVLDNVLNFTKPKESQLEKVDLNQIVDQTLEMMEGEINPDKITVMKYPHPHLPQVLVNPDQIRHALLNIFRNAIWVMSQGGILSVTTKKKDNFAKIEIKDTGFGISKEHLGGIFDAFFTTKPDSCGLGLTISSEIIKNHGGFIVAESAKGKGATFSVVLPLERDRSDGATPPLSLREENEEHK
ncbi:MAG: GAF domain-containing protein [candidate division Zixibacteria bacterium]|nr:GAF domain-containing protein [candidate division Zixibacteria bacterium]